MTMLDVATAYRLWAPSYSPENAVSAIEDRLVRAMTPPLTGLRLVDAGCGTGRRVAETNAARAIGIDQSAEMLGVARHLCPPHVELLQGDVRALPVADRCADLTWCRLVIGHLPECEAAYRELARITEIGGTVIVTDFHPDAHAAGHRRTFRTGKQVHEVEHYLHGLETHLVQASHAGLRALAVRTGAIDREVRHFYDDAGKAALFDRHLGLNVVLALAFRRMR
jgi:malonyl-CoA O-methyltransferase